MFNKVLTYLLTYQCCACIVYIMRLCVRDSGGATPGRARSNELA